MWRGLVEREMGAGRPSRVAHRITAERSRSLELSAHKDIVSAHKAGICSLQIDETEWRYLLAGAADGSVGVYDTLQSSKFDSASGVHQHEALFTVDKTAPQGHQFGVSSVQWYPVDTGLFVTGSFDHRINLWDTNTLQVESQFKMDGKVYGIGMSSVASTHMLIAAGTEDPRVRLCDIASGAFTHTLSGHRDGVWAVRWSVANEWVLITGGCDGAIRFWDIRRAGSYQVLDQHNTQIGRRPPVKSKNIQRGDEARASSNDYGPRADKVRRLTSEDGKNTKWRATPKKSVMNDGGIRRQHPGMLSSQNRAAAHYGKVMALAPTSDGYFLLSAGSDSRVKLWDMESACNTLVNYESTRLGEGRGRGMELSISSDSSLLFVPSATVIQVYDVWSGRLLKSLRGHYDAVNCCSFHPDQELYTGSNDRKILVWCPPSGASDSGEDEAKQRTRPRGLLETRPDEDAWSD